MRRNSGSLGPPKKLPEKGISTRQIFSFFSSLNTRVTAYVLALLGAAIVCSYYVTIHTMDREVSESIIRRAESLSRSISSAAGYHLILKDILALDNMVYKVKTANPDITSIAVIGEEEEIIVHTEIGKAGTRLTELAEHLPIAEVPGEAKDHGAGQTLIVESPVNFMDKNLGRVRLEIDWSVLHAAQAQARSRVIPLFGLIMILGIGASFFISKRMTRPLSELSQGVEQMKQEGRTKPLKVYSQDELGRLTASFNEMTSLVTQQREKLSRSAHELEEAYVATVKILAAAIEARDRYTLGHSTRVAELAVALAKEVKLQDEQVETIEIACLFHDVGKIRIPDAILHKKGRLNDDEISEMKRHPEYGAEILSKAPCLFKYIPPVRHHHEWYNGTGYPDGLKREEIPVTAAIISLADAFDAMTSDRPYRRALSFEGAEEIIKRNAGQQFDPQLAALFLKTLEKRRKSGLLPENKEEQKWAGIKSY
jgi:putative nucleotidyltransferase with HDIG domain